MKVIVIFAIITAILLIFIVLIQNSKGGGLDSSLSSTNQIMGVRKTTDFLEKATWSLVIVLAVLCIASAHFLNRGSQSQADTIRQNVEESAPAPVQEQEPEAE